MRFGTEKVDVGSQIYLGEVTASEGNNRLMFKFMGRNPLAKAWGLDLINVTFIKI